VVRHHIGVGEHKAQSLEDNCHKGEDIQSSMIQKIVIHTNSTQMRLVNAWRRIKSIKILREFEVGQGCPARARSRIPAWTWTHRGKIHRRPNAPKKIM